MEQRPDTPPSSSSAHATEPRRARSFLPSALWLLTLIPVVAALVLVGWPIPSTATAIPLAQAEPTAQPPERSRALARVDELPDAPIDPIIDAAWMESRIAPTDEMAETFDLLVVRSTDVPAPTGGDEESRGLVAASDEPRTAAGPRPVATPPAAQPPLTPTASPTSIPTPSPTPVPVAAVAPTASPTAAPTVVPTPAPTAIPTPTSAVAAGPPASNVGLSPREALLLDAMNGARVAAGLAPVAARADLTAVARARSEEMIRLDYFAHFYPGGRSAYELLAEAGITFAAAGENLAKTYGDVGESVTIAFDALMASATHRENILKSVYTQVGVGSFTNDAGVTIITAIFTDR